MDIVTLIFYASAFGFSSLLSICIFIIATSSNHPKIDRSKKEKHFLNPKDGELYPFPNLTEKYSVDLSIIIPAYNEEVRLRPMLDECTQFLEDRSKQNNFKYEIILVSDGSQDGTVKVGNEYCKQLGTEKFRILDLETNRGKGGAVRLGMLSARGSKLLFADADGATKFSDLTKLENALEELFKSKDGDIADELGISIGSRAHLEDEAVATRSIFRTILMFGFHALVWLFAVRGVRDTQCGFKLLTRRAAFICFNSLHVERWAFDVELLYIAQRLKIPIAEVAVNWTEIDGSKITPVWSWLQMGRDLFLIWLRYTIGAWKIRPQKTE